MDLSFTGLVLPGLLAAGVLVAIVIALGLRFAAPTPVVLGEPPEDLAAISVEIPSSSGSRLRGWFLPGRPGGGAVVLFHGVWGCRLRMLRRARLLNALGASVLIFDFQATGESPGRQITFGYLESLDARAAVAWIRQRVPDEKLAAVGISMGGAAALLGPAPLDVDALVLESVFSDIKLALGNRLRYVLGPLGPVVQPLFWRLLPPVLGLRPETLRPIEAMAALDMPVLVVIGAADRATTLAEARAMYALVRDQKQFWAVPGARHVDLQAFAPESYRKIVLNFVISHIQEEELIPQ